MTLHLHHYSDAGAERYKFHSPLDLVLDVEALLFDGSLASVEAIREWLGDDQILGYDPIEKQLTVWLHAHDRSGHLTCPPDTYIVVDTHNGHRLALPADYFYSRSKTVGLLP